MNLLFAQALEALVSGRIGLILVIALAVAAAVAGIAWFTLGKTRFAALGHAGVPAGFLAGFFLFLGVPPVLSGDPLHILPYIVLLGLISGLAVDAIAELDRVRLAAVLGWPALVVVAIGWREMPDFATSAGLPMAILWLAAVLAHLWMGTEQKSPITPAIVLFAFTIGIGLVAAIGGTKILTVLTTILSVAFIGLLAWMWPRPRFPFGATGMVGMGGAVLALAVAMVLYTTASDAAVAVLMLIFAVAPLASRLPGGGGKAGPFVLLVVCAIPVVLAGAVALHARGSLF
jgi:hypothetical protein